MRPEDSIPPPLRALDLHALVGRPLDEARAAVEEAGGRLQAVGSDEHQGLPTAMTADWRPDRVTVVVTAGQVVDAFVG